MTATGAGTPAATPGRAAYEALHRSRIARFDAGPDEGFIPWDELDETWKGSDGLHREDMEAAAQAAIKAHVLDDIEATSGDTVVIAFRGPVSARVAHDIRERWAAHAPGVALVIADNVAAIEVRRPASGGAA